MPKLLIKDAVKYYKDKGDIAITKNFLYHGCRTQKLPHCRIGNRFVIDTDELDRYLADLIKQQESPEVVAFGNVRRISV